MSTARIILVAIVSASLAVLVPKYLIHDSYKVSVEERACAVRDTNLLLDNPIERSLIFKTVVEKKEGSTLFTGSYTFFGLKYAEVKLVCNEGSQVIWRRWFVNDK